MSEVEAEILREVDYSLDFGRTRYSSYGTDGKGLASTILSIRDRKIVRAGFFSKEIAEWARLKE